MNIFFVSNWEKDSEVNYFNELFQGLIKVLS
ncbi:Uncharacterised protein [Escherichia coli]|nr:Uncharacterised protein [Escherichia coli]